ncbi:7,8-dihydro-6-hydroxymethylpterin dimethyltransferase [Pelomyxa schiedti]|nr:7,8-dihydro-6-hydroxymethylpterin dimethyltransferase [Pelomyxa schiedti]
MCDEGTIFADEHNVDGDDDEIQSECDGACECECECPSSGDEADAQPTLDDPFVIRTTGRPLQPSVSTTTTTTTTSATSSTTGSSSSGTGKDTSTSSHNSFQLRTTATPPVVSEEDCSCACHKHDRLVGDGSDGPHHHHHHHHDHSCRGHSSVANSVMGRRQRPVLRRKQFFLQLHLTDTCNLRCTHCYQESKRGGMSMTPGDVTKLLLAFSAFLKEMDCDGTIYYTGGEPLLEPQLCDYIRQARKLRIFPRVLSNGTMLTIPLALKLFDARIGVLQVSIDGVEATHDSFRGPGAFKRAIEALDIARVVGITTAVMLTLSRKNVAELEQIVQLCVAHEVTRFAVGRLVPMGTGEALEEDVLRPDELEQAYLLLSALEDKYGTQTQFVTKDPLWMQLAFEHNCGCSVGKNGICVIQNGDILACRRMGYVVGNLHSEECGGDFLQALHKAWECEDMQHLRSRDNFQGNCGRCSRLHQCGGCRGVAYAMRGSIFSGDPNCWYCKETAEEKAAALKAATPPVTNCLSW